MNTVPTPTATPYASASLYVGDLLNDVTETQLFEIFKQVGPVASIRVCRDAVTRRSLGYAYVNYHNFNDAERALDLMNYKDIKGRPCRIMWSQRDPSLRKTGTGNIFIKNLDKGIDNKALYDTFASFGNILSCKIALDEIGNSKGYGFVHYETYEAGQLAIEKVNNKLLNGKRAFVGPFLPRKDRISTESPKWTNIYVKNLEKTIDDQKFLEMFSQYGKVTSAMLMKNPEGVSRGFGFVNFEKHEQAQKAIDEMNGKEFNGQEIFVGKAQKKAEREKELKEMFEKLKRERMSKYQGVNLFIKNLDDTVDDAKLRQEFSPCGTITSAKVMKDEKGVSKGFGFVCFSTPDEATKAVTEMNGKMIVNKPIYVALAQRKEQRRAQLELNHLQRAGMRMQQAQGGSAIPVYPGAAPAVYYPQRNAFMYPQMMPRTRFPSAPQPRPGGFQSGMSYVVPMGGQPRSQTGPKSGGRGKGQRQPGSQVPGYPGIKYNANVRNPQVQENAASISSADKQILGETLFPRVNANLKASGKDDNNAKFYAGKITGMILESMEHMEIVHLIENPDALNAKITEALEVLAQHAAEANTAESNPEPEVKA